MTNLKQLTQMVRLSVFAELKEEGEKLEEHTRETMKAHDLLSKQRSNFAEVREKVAHLDLTTKIVKDLSHLKRAWVHLAGVHTNLSDGKCSKPERCTTLQVD